MKAAAKAVAKQKQPSDAPPAPKAAAEPAASDSLERCARWLREQPATAVRLPPCASYCFNWLLRGECRKPESCTYRHAPYTESGDGGRPAAGPGASPPAARAPLAAGGGFARGDAFKRASNAALAALSRACAVAH